jgi:cysteine desulfurase/selenocysteine lyase
MSTTRDAPIAKTRAKTAERIVLDIATIRKDFPILRQKVHGKSLVYLDNAASAPKPQSVIDTISRFYAEDYSNIHRGVYELSQRATKAYEDTRVKVRRFINAKSENEIVFVRGTTEAVNLIAYSFGQAYVKEGDEILITAMEHHSNIVPWQILCKRTGAHLKVAPIDKRGDLKLEELEKFMGSKTRLVALAHVSNALGTVNPVKQIVEMAHSRDIPVLVDGAQAVPHAKVDVQELGCDFYCFSGHKMYGPSGVGVLYGREKLLDAMPPYEGGGDMISSVTFEKTTYNRLPYKFEAGTPNIAGVVGLGAAIDYLNDIGVEAVAKHEDELLDYGTKKLLEIPGLSIVGQARHKTSVLSFVHEAIHPHDIGTILDQEGIAIRTGHHCAQPVMDFFGVPATARASLGVFNEKEDLDALARGIGKVLEVFA